MQSEITMLEPNDVLMQAFHHHGHPEARIEGGWVVFPDHPPARASIYLYDTPAGLVNLQLDVEIALDDGRVIVESCAGLGKDQDDALNNGFSKFSANAFHALLTAFYDYPIEDQINGYEWDVDGVVWDAFMGPLTTMVIPMDGPAEPEAVRVIPDHLVDFIQNKIRSRLSEDRQETHWVRFFYAQQNGEMKASEVLWDNEAWEAAQQQMGHQLAWPKIDGFASVRSFTVLRRKGSDKHTGSGENAPAIERAVALLVEVVEHDPNVEDEQIYQQLTTAGVTPALAKRVILFGPMAFSRLLLRDAYPTDYQIHSETPPYETHPLLNEPVFALATHTAASIAGEPDRRSTFMALASRCAVFNAANQALHQGAKLENLMFSPPIVFLDGFQARSAAREKR